METKSDLFLREWLTLAFFSAFILAILLFSLIEQHEKAALVECSLKKGPRVYIEGEVENPGMLALEKGTTLLEALNKAGLKSTSNIDKLELTRVVKDGERIKIRMRKMITIRLIYPEAREEELELPAGSTVA